MTRKKPIIYAIAGLVLAIATSQTAVCDVISSETALQRAFDSSTALRKAPSVNKQNIRLLSTINDATGTPAVYTFTGSDRAWLLSADDAAAPILAELDAPLDAGKMPETLDFWLDYYASAIELMRANPSKAPSTPDDVLMNLEEIPQIMTTRWGQNPPFSNLCPGPYTGCVATAMAQVLKCHRFPERYDWDNMIDFYSYWDSSQYTPEQAQAVQELMRDCGKSVNMYYDSQGAEAQERDVPGALINFFGYDKGCFLYRSAYEPNFALLAYHELKKGYPLFFQGAGARDNHAYVCDGFKDGKFHMNLGWDGQADGYYLINYVDAWDMLFNSTFSFVARLTHGDATNDKVYKYLLSSGMTSPDTNVKLGEILTITTLIMNHSAVAVDWTHALRLVDLEDENHVEYSEDCYMSNTYVGQGWGSPMWFPLPKTLPVGKYKATLAHREEDGTWKRIRVNLYQQQFLILTVDESGNVLVENPNEEEQEIYSSYGAYDLDDVEAQNQENQDDPENREDAEDTVIPVTELLFDGNPVENGAEYTTYSEEMVAGMIWVQDSKLSLRGPVGQMVTIQTEGDNSYQVCWPSNCIRIEESPFTHTAVGTIGEGRGLEPGSIITENLAIDEETRTSKEDMKPIVLKVRMTPTGYPEQEVNITVNMSNQSKDESVGINIMSEDNQLESVYYDISGRKVENPNRGIYILVKGEKTEKIFVP